MHRILFCDVHLFPIFPCLTLPKFKYVLEIRCFFLRSLIDSSYLEESLKILVRHSGYFHEDVRLQAVISLKREYQLSHIEWNLIFYLFCPCCFLRKL